MRGKKQKETVLPEFIVAGCGRNEGFTERRREVTNEKRRRRREEGEQQFDLRLVSSHLLYTSFFVVSLLRASSFRTFWGPRRTLASGSRLSRTWGNPRRCSCQEPGRHTRINMFDTLHLYLIPSNTSRRQVYLVPCCVPRGVPHHKALRWTAGAIVQSSRSASPSIARWRLHVRC